MAERREEDLEVKPGVFIVVRDDQGSVVRRVEAKRKKGLHRVAWDLRWPAASPTDLRPKKDLPPWAEPERGPMVLPGAYSATLEERSAGWAASSLNVRAHLAAEKERLRQDISFGPSSSFRMSRLGP